MVKKKPEETHACVKGNRISGWDLYENPRKLVGWFGVAERVQASLRERQGPAPGGWGEARRRSKGKKQSCDHHDLLNASAAVPTIMIRMIGLNLRGRVFEEFR